MPAPIGIAQLNVGAVVLLRTQATRWRVLRYNEKTLAYALSFLTIISTEWLTLRQGPHTDEP